MPSEPGGSGGASGTGRPRRIAPTLALIALPLLLVALAVAAIMWGSASITPGRIWAVVGHKLGLIGPISGGVPIGPGEELIVWQLRLPRVLLAALVGAMLALSGTALQALVRNPLADPYVLGVSSGASMGAVAVMAFGSAAIGGLSVPLAAFAGASLVLVTVYLFAQRRGAFTDSRIVLAGVALGYVAMAVTSFLQLQADPGALRGILFWSMGSVAGGRWPMLLLPLIVLVVFGGWLATQGRTMNALALGDDDAIAVGVNLQLARIGLLIAASALTAVAVSVAGGIGFVGLIVPHVMRLLCGADHRLLLPISTLAGAVFLVAVDLFARIVGSPYEYPITIFTALIGGPFFLWLLRSRQAATL